MPALRDQGAPRRARATNGLHAPSSPPSKKPNPFRISETLLGRVGPTRRVAPTGQTTAPQLLNPFQVVHTMPPGVAGKRDAKPIVAMDEAGLNINTWAMNTVVGLAYSEGLAFPGYIVLAQMAQRAEYRCIVETIATEMTRKWIRLQSKTSADRKAAKQKAGEAAGADEDRNGTDDDQTRRIGALNDFLDKLKVRDAFREAAEQDGFFGRSHLFPDIGDADDRDEMRTPIGNGIDKLSELKVNQRKPLLGVRAIEPMWCYPLAYNSTNPLRADWYKPQEWYAMSHPIHVSRLLTFVGREVPDILKPAYSFGGLALTQMAKPYVDNWLRTRQSVSDLIHAFSVFVLSTDLGTLLQGDGDLLLRRADLFNRFRDNRGLMLVGKDTEQLDNVSAPLGSLDALLAMSQEQMASVARIPLVKLLGISPKGLNASSEGEIRVFYDSIQAYQERFFTDHLRTIIAFAQLTLWGKIDPDITSVFEPLWSLDEKALAEKRKVEADTDMVYVDGGVLDPGEVRQRIAADPDTPYAGIDPDDVPEPPEPMMQPGGGEEDDDAAPNGQQPPRKPNGDGRAAAEDAVIPFAGDDGAFVGWAADAEFSEADHPRGQPGNAGQFGSGGGGGKGGKQKLKAPQYGMTPTPSTPHQHQGGETGGEYFEKNWAKAGSVGGHSQPTAKQVEAYTGAYQQQETGPQSPHEGKRGKFKASGTGNLAEQGFAPKKKGSGSNSTEAMQVAWHVAKESGKPQTITVNNLGYILLKKGEAIPHGHPHIVVDPEGNVTRYQADLGGGERDASKEESGKNLPAGGPLDPAKLKKVEPQMGSNPGGVYEGEAGEKFYIKKGKTKEHVRSELLAGSLYQLAGARTLDYVPVQGGEHIATRMQKLDKNNVNKFNPEEIKTAQQDFAVHAWLANWDATGLGGDNLGTVGGEPTALDLGGTLEWRAQGGPKGAAFGDKAGEMDTLRNAQMNPDNAKVFGPMSPDEIRASAERVTSIPDEAIRETVKASGSPDALADKLIARKRDIAKRVGIQAHDEASDESDLVEETLAALDEFDLAEHPQAPAGTSKGGQFVAKGGGGSGGGSAGGGESGGGAFKTKKEHVAHLLAAGTTTADVLKATGWPAVSMPAMAKALGLNLQKVKEGGVTKYKGTPMSSEELAQLKADLVNAKKEKAAAAITPATPTVAAAPVEKAKPSSATPEDLKKAAKGTKVPPTSSSAGNTLIDKFNQKYAGKELTDPAAIEQKIADYKTMTAQVQEANANFNTAASAAQAEAKAKAEATAKAAGAAAAGAHKKIMEELGINDEEASAYEALAQMVGGGLGNALSQFKSLQTKAAGLGLPINGFETAMIQSYTGSAYREINKALRTGAWTSQQHLYVKTINKALAKMPAHVGTTNRGAELPPSAQALYAKPGYVIDEKAFMSTSKGAGWQGNTRFVVSGKSGRDIQKLSSHHNEAEVLYPARTLFRIEKVEGNPGGKMTVHMREIG